MKFLFPIFLFGSMLCAQTNHYEISFDNAVHHEAVVQGTFPELKNDTVAFRMSRSSPGRYALHEFAKNVYDFKATDSKGKGLQVLRPDPYQWQVVGHDGTITIHYTLFANRGGGTYSQVDETHAHLNIPATFMYVPSLKDRKIEVDFKVRKDLNWKVATQLPLVSGTTYSAPNLYYFMDSPTELSDFSVREFEVEDHGKKQKVRFVLHHNGTEEELDAYFENVKKVVLAEREVYGELPEFDYGTYTFLACYIPNASGDGMEHRNSTILTSTRPLANGGAERNIGTVSHEFFHAWNVERIRPKGLEPFDFEKANMSGALWFAEGFTSYYTQLNLCRAGIISPEKYVEGISGTFNYVWNSPARRFFNPVGMSYQAPFVDAATSVDPVNRENTFISYYSYGSVLGLALDLSLREEKLNLDDFMKQVWNTYGISEIPYTLENLQQALADYAGRDFADTFFDSYIYKSGMPDYKALLNAVGVTLAQDAEEPYFGAAVALNGDGHGEIRSNPKIGTPAYVAGLDKGVEITAINGQGFPDGQQFSAYIKGLQVGDTLKIVFNRYGVQKETNVVLASNPNYRLFLSEKEGAKVSKKQLQRRNEWLKTEEN
ncbi:M61 family metallopeptidase [Maribacter polysiphoniae]|uniref:M61 family metallopeptidase n=1 Tax=Maribacter polysiphoniae TaxID=429344 RepID=A0A316E5S3_9FLAO|nr:PDZ domain-containing protein [Maribacter polysiphoniae]MBD1259312.1 M61 family metallopeptidase [Maribacter polysiphoniae]PWK24872.1 putative metalloprotease with PDZ domain [Maribacter polysiphoniae]